MKKILFLLFLLLGFVTQSYTQIANQCKRKNNIEINYGEHNWYSVNNLYGNHDWGIPNFYWGISKSIKMIGGRYEYKLWFTSGSYIWDSYYNVSVWKYVYCDNFRLWVDGKLLVVNINGFTFKELYNEPSLTFTTSNPNPIVVIITQQKML